MNSSFRTKLTVVLAALIAVAVLAVAASALLQGRAQVRTAAETRVAQSLQILGELFATRRAQVVIEGAQLAADRPLLTAAERANAREVTQRLAARVDSSHGHFAVVLARGGDLLGIAGGHAPASGLDELAAMIIQSDKAAPHLVVLDGAIYQIAITPADGERFYVINGFEVNGGLAARVEAITGVAVMLRSAAEPVSADLPARRWDKVASVTLEESDGIKLVADILLPHAAAFAPWVALAKQTLAVALAALLLTLTSGALWMRATVRRDLERPLGQLREGFRRAMAGDYTQPVNAVASSAYAPMIRAFNDMQIKISEREGRIVHHAQYDTLTGLTNRSVVNERIQIAVAKAQRRGSSVAAIALDLSRFNEVNDSLGHDVGDEVLKEVARRLASNTSVSDTVSRVGGDEFLVVLEDADEKLAGHLAEFLVASLETVIKINGSDIRLHVHAGLAMYPMHCDAHDALRRMANIALLTAKEKGERVVTYEPGQDEKQLRELAIIHDLPNAIRCNELYLQYQPKIDVETQRVEYVEALVRWRHPQLGFIPPDEFITLLEKSGRIGQLTDWVLKEAVKQCRAWSDEGYDLGIAINISANDLSDVSLPDRVHMLMSHYLVDARRIAIEVTESAVIQDPERSIQVLNAFRKHGLKIALDDFGTGQTSLALLKKMPLTEIKIDKSFVQSLRADSGDAIIVKSIIDLGHNMGLVVTAEGVESNYCWNLLNSYGCDLVQGYLVSAPLTGDELREWYLRLQERHVHQLDYSFVRDASA